MLPAAARLRRRADFTETLRRGRRVGRPTLVVALLQLPRPLASAQAGGALPPPRVGFVVGRQVGGATVRNRLRRRLRHAMADRLHMLPAGSLTVVRALPGADRLSTAGLATELDATLARLVGQPASGSATGSGRQAGTSRSGRG